MFNVTPTVKDELDALAREAGECRAIYLHMILMGYLYHVKNKEESS